MPYEFSPPLEITDFSGGFNDNFIDGPTNSGQTIENLLIQKNKKLLSRDGTLIYDSTAYQIPAGNQRIGKLISHPQVELFVQSARDLYYINSTYQTLTGPVNSNPSFSANTITNYISTTRWKNHVYMVSDSFADPIKVYKDSGSVWRVNTAGLPGLDLEGAIDLANDLKAKYNLHRVQGTRHSPNDTVNVVTSPDAWDFDSLVTLVSELTTDLNAHFTDAALPAGRAFHPNQETPTSVLTSVASVTTVDQILTRLDDIKSKYNQHDANTSTHNAGTLNQVAVIRTPAVSGSVGTENYLYRLLYRHTYTVGDVTFEVLGATTQISGLLLTTGTKTISSIPAISNGSTRCYDTATITCDIYRTESNGTVYYFVGRVTNGTTSFTDTVADSTLVNNLTIYTDGGALDHDTPPRAKFIHVVNNVAVFGNVKEGTINYASRFRMSIPDSPDHCPDSLGDDVEVPITGVNSVGIYPIIFGRDRTYRIEGIFDELGRGTVQTREISRTKGCISNNSIVQITGGLVFAGIDQFYFTDGYTVSPIDTHHIESYKELVSLAAFEPKISGRYDSKENRVYWCVPDGTTTSDNNKMWVLDLNFQFGTKSSFTKLSNTDSWNPTDIEFFTNSSQVSKIVIADTRGYLFKFDANTFTDPDINVATNPSTWPTNQVIYNYKSFAGSFGTITKFKFIPNMTLQAKNVGDITIQVNSNNEDSGLFSHLKEMRIRGGITWGDPNIYWNMPPPDYLWNINPLIKQMRRFPAGKLRTVYKQVQITNAYTIITNSDTISLANTDSAIKTVTLTDVAQAWPTDIVNYFISFEDDGYTNDFLVTSRTSDTVIVYSDVTNVSANATSGKWVIRGYKKGEQLNLLSYSLNYAMLDESQTVYRGETGGNA